MAESISGRSFEFRDFLKLKDSVKPETDYDYSEVHDYVNLPQKIYDELKDKLLYVEHAYNDNTLKLRIYDPEENEIDSPREWDIADADIDFTFECFFIKVDPIDWVNEKSSNKIPVLKIGDRVTVIDDLTKRLMYPYYNTRLNIEKEIEISPSYRTKYEGKQVTIAKVFDGKYEIEDREYSWCNSMFKETRHRFKPGDLVYVESKMKSNSAYRFYDCKNNKIDSMGSATDMARLAGKQVTIKKINKNGSYGIENDRYDYAWTDSMFMSQEEYDDLILSSTVLPEEPEAKPAAKPAGRYGGQSTNPFGSSSRGTMSPYTPPDESRYRNPFSNTSAYTHVPNKIPMPAVTTATDIFALPTEHFEKTDIIKLKDCIKNSSTYLIRGKEVKLNNVERYKGKTWLFGDCQDDGNKIRFYHNGCIHVNEKDLFEKVNKNNTKIKLTKNNEEERGECKMNNMNEMMKRMFGEIGQVEDGSLAMTFTGQVAVQRTNGDYVRYDAAGENIENQGEFVLEGSDKFMMLMPSPTVAVGDIIKNGNKYNQVVAIKPNGSLTCINYATGTKTTIVKETNVFGMNFYTKVISMMTGMTGGDNNPTTPGAPGAFNPMMLMALMGDDNKEMDMTTLLMVSGMFGGQQNPAMMMMPLLMMGKKDGENGGSKDMMKTMAMMSMFSGGNSPFGAMFGQPQQPAVQPAITQTINYEELSKNQAKMIEALQTQINTITSGKLEGAATVAAEPKKKRTYKKKTAKVDEPIA